MAAVTEATQLEGATLFDILRHLAGRAAELVVAPRGLSTRVLDTAIHDPVSEDPIEPGTAVFAVGVDPTATQARRLVADCGVARATAIVFRSEEALPPKLIAAAEAAGVALLRANAQLSWGRLHGLLRSIVAAAGPTVDDSPTAVPLGDVAALANAIASAVGGATAIYDRYDRMLAHSTLNDPIDEARQEAILGGHSPPRYLKQLRHTGHLAQMLQTPEVVHVEYPGLRRRLNIAVRAGQEVVGDISVCEGETPFRASAETTLREMATVAAPHLEYHLTQRDSERWLRADALRAILEGRGEANVLAAQLAFDPAEPVAVLVFEASVGVPDAGPVGRALDLISFRLESLPRVLCASLGKRICVLLLNADQARRQELRRLASDVLPGAAGILDADVYAGCGSTVATAAEASRSRREAEEVIAAVRQAGQPPQVADIEEQWAPVALAELKSLANGQPQFEAGKVARLIEHDLRHGTMYAQTLRAYFDAYGDVRRAADAIKIHPNTFRYRIRRVAELSGLDLDNADERLVAELQLRFL